MRTMKMEKKTYIAPEIKKVNFDVEIEMQNTSPNGISTTSISPDDTNNVVDNGGYLD